MSKSDATPIFLTHDRHVAELERHWRLLWVLPGAERKARIEEIRLDLEYDDLLAEVAIAVQESYIAPLPKPRLTPTDRPRAAIWSALITFDLAAIFLGGYVLWQMIR